MTKMSKASHLSALVERRFDLKKRKSSMGFDGEAAGNCICHCRVDSGTEYLQDPVYLSNGFGRFAQLANIAGKVSTY